MCHEISVTPNWLLGFVEGEGSFVVAKRQYTLIFSTTQPTREEVLTEEIKILLNNFMAAPSFIEQMKVDAIDAMDGGGKSWRT